MTAIETRPSSEPRFALREEATPTPHPSERFLIRPGTPAQRDLAVREFEKDAVPTRAPREARPGMSELLLNAERLLLAGEKSSAAHLIRQALCLDSRHPEALKKMLRTLGHAEWELQQKLQIRKTLVQVQPTFENFALYGQVLIDANQPETALEAFFEATLRVQEESHILFDVYKHMGNIYVRKADFEAAEEAYHKAFALDPDSDVLQVNLGTLAVQKQDWGAAIEKFRRALELNSMNDKAWVGLGLCHRQVGEFSLAEATLHNALDICPSNRTAVHLLASWSLPDGGVERATERLQDYLSTQESDVEMSLVLIHLFCHRHRFEWARLELERALCWAPEREDLLQLQKQLMKTGDGEAA